MDNTGHTPALVAAPRHLRKRFLRADIADTLLAPGAHPLPVATAHGQRAERPRGATSRIQSYGRKRAVALVAVIVVSISIPALMFALVLAG